MKIHCICDPKDTLEFTFNCYNTHSIVALFFSRVYKSAQSCLFLIIDGKGKYNGNDFTLRDLK